jgi:hypothetical protein
VIVDEGDGVSVAIDLDGTGVVGGHPAHLHLGTCDGFDPLRRTRSRTWTRPASA